MTKYRAFITRRIPQVGLDILAKDCELEISPHDRPLGRDELLAKVGDVDGVIGLLTDRVDGEFFDAAPRLKGYANFAVGFDNLDIPEATRRGIPVSNTPEVLTLATAEAAWSLLLAVARRVVETDDIMRSGFWSGWGPLQFIGADVSRKTLESWARAASARRWLGSPRASRCGSSTAASTGTRPWSGSSTQSWSHGSGFWPRRIS